TFDGFQLGTVGLHREHQTGAHGLVVEQNRASPAHTVFTADMCACQAKIIANEIYQQFAWLDVALVFAAVDLDPNFLLAHRGAPGVARAAASAHARRAKTSHTWRRYSALA